MLSGFLYRLYSNTLCIVILPFQGKINALEKKWNTSKQTSVLNKIVYRLSMYDFKNNIVNIF
jgi:hypothetical protein